VIRRDLLVGLSPTEYGIEREKPVFATVYIGQLVDVPFWKEREKILQFVRCLSIDEKCLRVGIDIRGVLRIKTTPESFAAN
jgi:hypothetical protein